MSDAPVRELLESLTPDYRERRGDWDAVLRDARPRPRRRVRVTAAAAVAAAASLAVLAWPFGTQEGGVLERALAAIGEGPVLHAVLRGEWGGTLIDLDTGARHPILGEQEVWYDTERGIVRWILRRGGTVQHDVVYEPGEPQPKLDALGRDYRQALESGTARVTEEATIDGEPVAWVAVRSRVRRDDGERREHEWAQEVAVSRRTFLPVALRRTRDGEPAPYSGERVLSLELLQAGAVDFDRPPGRTWVSGRWSREPVALAHAPATLGRRPLWLGRAHAGLPLAQVFKETSVVWRPQGDRFVSEELPPAVVLFYGTLADDPGTSRLDPTPLLDRPHVTVTQSRNLLVPGTPAAVPGERSLFVAAGARRGVFRVDGLHVAIDAADEQSLLAAARGLEPMPGP